MIPDSVLAACRGATEILAAHPRGEHPFLELADAFRALHTAWSILEEETDYPPHLTGIDWRWLSTALLDAATRPTRAGRIEIVVGLENKILRIHELAGPLPGQIED
jgi:hypothetical protein